MNNGIFYWFAVLMIAVASFSIFFIKYYKQAKKNVETKKEALENLNNEMEKEVKK